MIGTNPGVRVVSAADGRHNRLSAFGVIGTSHCLNLSLEYQLSHNRLSAFGVIGTYIVRAGLKGAPEKSQSPFGFWGDRNPELYY